MSLDCIILTDSRYLHDSSDPYKHNVYYEDNIVKKALISKGLQVTRKAWDDPLVDWSSTQSVLFRTTWDYFDRFEEFSKWLDHVSKVTVPINSNMLIRWNLDKHYLEDLDQKGIPIPKTRFIEKGEKTDLQSLHNELQCRESVLKPCISGAGRHTYRLNPSNYLDYENIFQELLEEESLMLQPFQYNIVSKGEISLMIINGKFTHAVLKKAKEGDFRVQDDFGGTVYHYQPNANEIVLAEKAVKACPEFPIYARVDMFLDNDNELAISELELIEPELWFRNNHEAANILANGIADMLSRL